MPDTTLTSSERRARTLLAAWNSGELARLEDALDRTAGDIGEDTLPACEQERFDLLQQITLTIRAWLSAATAAKDADLKAALGLLRHLARCERSQMPARGDLPVGPRRTASSASFDLLASLQN